MYILYDLLHNLTMHWLYSLNLKFVTKRWWVIWLTEKNGQVIGEVAFYKQ